MQKEVQPVCLHAICERDRITQYSSTPAIAWRRRETQPAATQRGRDRKLEHANLQQDHRTRPWRFVRPEHGKRRVLRGDIIYY